MNRHLPILSLGLGVAFAGALVIGCEDAPIPSSEGVFTPIPDSELTLGSDSVDFGSVTAGSPATRDVTVNNLGDQDVVLRGFYLEGFTENWSVEGCTQYVPPAEDETPPATLPESGCTGLVVPAGGSLDVGVVFDPTVKTTPTECADRAAVLTLVFYSSTTSELTVSLSGIGESDTDGDGELCYANSDCDDTDATVNPSADEICDEIDNDCDGVLPTDEADEDNDRVPTCAGDCDDQDRTVAPGKEEVDDDKDNDCDEAIDEGL